jgi:glycosyltransferase involved in cell wall biosynthesis
MYRQHKIAITFTCHNEEKFVGPTIEGLPDFIDGIFITDDGSTDKTSKVIQSYIKLDPRINLTINHLNKGGGYSVAQSFKQIIKDNYDISCITAGDNQCRPEYLKDLIDAIITDGYDYAKGNRFVHQDELKQMPPFRRLGNIFMSLLSKFASGYYSIIDPLNSYSAIKVSVLKEMDLDALPHRYDFENGWLMQLYLQRSHIKDVPIPARYAGEKSDIQLLSYIPRTSLTLWHNFWQRVISTYVINSFHPVAVFLFSGLTLFCFGTIFGLYVAISSIGPKTASTATVMLSVVPFILGFQLLLQAIVLDIQNEPK